MSISTPPRGTHFADGVRVGPILGTQFKAGANVLSPSTVVPTPVDRSAPGIYVTPTSWHDIIPFAVSTANVAALQTPGAAGYITLLNVSNAGITWMATYENTSGPLGAGVIKLDVPRNITVTGVTNTTAANFTIFGWDQYGQPMVETITGPVGAATVVGVKAWNYIQGIYASAGTAQNISVGVGNVYGLPYFLGDANYLTTQRYNGALDVGTIVVADPRTATATTGDVRGTYAPASNADSTKRLTLNMYNASGDTRNYYNATGATIYLINNPLTVTNGSAVITVAAYGHSFTNGENVTISGATATGLTGLGVGNINITAPVTVINENSFSYVATANATTGATGGGAAVQMTPGNGNLYQSAFGRFGVSQYTQNLF
jgi:hypothetical protein